MRFVYLTLLISALLTNDAYAYVGPGVGLGAIGAFLAMVLAVLLAIVGIVWYPLKRMLRRRSVPKDDTKDSII